MSMDFINAPSFNNYGLPMSPTGAIAPQFTPQYPQQPMMTQQQQQNAAQMQQMQAKLASLETPKITTSGTPFFTVVKDGEENKSSMIPVDKSVSDMSKEAEKRKRAPRKEQSKEITGIVRAEPQTVQTVEEMPTAYTYMETTGMLRDTLQQIDALNAQLMQEFASVKQSRTMKNKYQVMVGLSENVGALLSTKVSTIREINSSISKSNDLDYKKDKDRKAATAALDDDKYIADLYKGFIQNPINVAPTPQVPQVDPSIFGSGVVRADLRSGDYNSNGPVDVGYLNYMSNLSPEQNLFRYEGNNNVKQVVVFDASNGNKFFQVMDISTNQVIPNVPVYDQMFMEDTTIDLATRTAKNINLNESFPVVVINEGVTSQY